MADPSELFGNALMMGVRQGREAEQAQFENALRTKQLSMAEQQQNALLPLQVQQAQMGIASDQARIQAIREQSRLQAQEYARSVSADQIARETAETRQALMEASGAYKAGDQNAWNATISKYGLDPAQFPMDNAPALFAVAEGSLDVWEGLTAPKQQGFRPATAEEAAQYGAPGGQIDQSTGRFHPINPPSGVSATVGPDGTLQFAQGPGVQGKPFTEAQSKDNVFTVRAEGALALLDSVGAEALASRADRVLDAVPMGIGREAQGDTFQVAQQAGDEFLQAILRKDTGAAITAGEQDLYGKTYLPQPGDKPAVIEAKRAARLRAIEALKSGASVQQITAQERALVESARTAASSRGEQDPLPTDAPDFLSPMDRDLWNDYDDSERRIILKAYDQ